MSKQVSRREFLKRSGVAVATLTSLNLPLRAASRKTTELSPGASIPWYRRVLRWGQTNINEQDPTRYDIAWWREYWKRTQTQGVIINAGGIVAYYPSKFPLHRRARFLGDRDLFGELSRAAHEDGLAVLARMDSGGANEDFKQEHPDWFSVDATGQPYRSRDLFVPCINGPYFREYIPELLREIAQGYHPEGFTDNSWSGLGRGNICYCKQCVRKFREQRDHPLPLRHDWNDAIYRDWIEWSYRTRLEIWDLNNQITRAAGGPDCLWVGMNSGSISGQCQSFRNYKEICDRAQIILLDHQARSDNAWFQQNAEIGKSIHELLGWDKLIPESMAMYQAGRTTFRFSAKPESEARLWMLEGFAGGIQPWWHHVGAFQEDQRAFSIAEPINRWHRANERFLTNRTPIATLGVVWSQENTDFYGRDHVDVLVEQPWRGMAQALVRARIPYLPVHADHIERAAGKFAALILPNFCAMSESQISSVRQFVQHGGGLLATGESSLRTESGEWRPDFALAGLYGAHTTKRLPSADDPNGLTAMTGTQHTYLRIAEERPGPGLAGGRHRILRGFEQTSLLPFGGMLSELRLDSSVQVPLTFVPPFPVYPPESVWMREPRTTIPGLILREEAGIGRIAFLPADLDRRFARDNLPDHGDLLANIIRWTAADDIPLMVSGPGLIDCHLYHQPGRMILHLINLTNAGTWRQPVHELIPVGPLKVQMKLSRDVPGNSACSLVSANRIRMRVKSNWVSFEISALRDQEVVVLT